MRWGRGVPVPASLVLAFPGGQSPEVLEQSARFLTWRLGKQQPPGVSTGWSSGSREILNVQLPESADCHQNGQPEASTQRGLHHGDAPGGKGLSADC